MSKYKRRIHGQDNFVTHMKMLIVGIFLSTIIAVTFPIKWWHG